MSDMCAYCRMDTAGNHEWDCPLHPSKQPLTNTVNMERVIMQSRIEPCCEETAFLRNRVAELEAELAEVKDRCANLDNQLLGDVTVSDWAIEHLKEIDRIRAENERLKTASIIDQTTLSFRHSEIKRLREGLRKYGRHIHDTYGVDCAMRIDRPETCSCGLLKLLEEGK